MTPRQRLDAARAQLDQPAADPVPGQLAVETGPRIGSLCTGYGGLDMAAAAVFGGSVAWHAQYDPTDRHQYAARILAHHWPDVPNHGDITGIDWSAVEPIDILTAGFPCQDVSCAGNRAGIAEGTRSGLWAHVARAAAILLPEYMVIENVEGLLSARADRGLGPDGTPVDESGPAGTLRALGAVLGDLAAIGFDAEWVTLPASGVGAVHQRKRVFILARRAADAASVGHERGRRARNGRPGPTDGGQPVADAASVGHGDARPARVGGVPSAAVASGPAATPDANSGQPERRRVAGVLGSQAATEPLEGDQRQRAGNAARHRGEAPADAEGERRGEGGAEPAGQQGGPCASSGSAPNWGGYGPAVARWEAVTDRPVPGPVDDRGRLAPAFVEWMMGLPAGHVTAVPGLPRNAQLKALGNGVVPQQAAYALRLLAARYTAALVPV